MGEIIYEYKEVGVQAGFTDEGRKKNLEKLKEKMAKEGWELDSYFNGGLTKASNAKFKRDINYIPEKRESSFSIKNILIGFVVVVIFTSLYKEDENSIENNSVENSINNSDTTVDTENLTEKNMKLVIDSLKNNYKIEPVSMFDQKIENDFCRNERFCEIKAKEIQIQVMHRTITPLSNSKVSPQDYKKICSAVVMGITNANKELIEGSITDVFNYASQHGRGEVEIAGAKINISPRMSDDLLECKIVSL